MAILQFPFLAEEDLDAILEFIGRDKPQAAIEWVQSIPEYCIIFKEDHALVCGDS